MQVWNAESGKGKEEYLYSAFLAKVVHSKRSAMDNTVLPANNTMPASRNVYYMEMWMTPT